MITTGLFALNYVCKRHYLEIWRDTTNKEHHILGVEVKQRVSAWSFAFLDELLLVCGALTRDGQKDFSMSAQPASKNTKGNRERYSITTDKQHRDPVIKTLPNV